MQSTEKPRFANMLDGLCSYYQRAPLDKTVIAIYWDGLCGYSYEEVYRAVRAHMAAPDSGSFFPKISDLVRHMPRSASSHPGIDEAWALCMRMAGEEDSAVITAEMREAWAIAWPVLDGGDDVGARLAFKEAYRRIVGASRDMPVWEIQIGSNSELRAQRVSEAVELGRLPKSALEVHALSAPSEGIAGLLKGAKERIRLAAEDGKVVDQATQAISHLQAIKAMLEARHDPELGIAEREEERQMFEAHRAEELERLRQRMGDGSAS